MVEIERWQTIPEFRDYEISDRGRIYNKRRDIDMSISYTNHGHAKISLSADWSSERFTRSVARLVAQSFVEAPNLLCDQVILLDGDHSNVRADNLAWRPAHFAWKYSRQLTTPQPTQYHNLAVMNLTKGLRYDSIVEAGMAEGLLFEDIWRSTYMGSSVFPDGCIFEIIERV